jgi:hypothetical protein
MTRTGDGPEWPHFTRAALLVGRCRYRRTGHLFSATFFWVSQVGE